MVDVRTNLPPVSAGGGVSQPPVDTSTASAIGSITQGAASLANALSRKQAAEKVEAGNQRKASVLSNFASEMEKIDRAITDNPERGAELRAKASALKMKTTAAFGEYSKEIAQVWKSSTTDTEIGESFEGDQAEQDRKRQLMNDAQAAGKVLDGKSDQEVDEILGEFQKEQRALTALDLLTKQQTQQFAEEKHEMAVSRYEQEQKQWKLNEQVKAALTNVAVESMPGFQRNLQETINAVRNKDIDPGMGEKLINDSLAALEGIASQKGANTEQINALLMPYRTLAKSSLDFMSNKMNAETYKNMKIAAINKTQAGMLASSQEVLNRVAGSGLLNFSLPPSQMMTKAVLNTVYGYDPETEPADPAPRDTKTSKAALGLIQNAIKTTNTPDDGTGRNEKVLTEASEMANAFLAGIDQYSKMDKTSKEYASVVNFIASNEFKTLLDHGKLNKQQMAAAAEILRDKYVADVNMMLRRDLSDDMIPTFELGTLKIMREEKPRTNNMPQVGSNINPFAKPKQFPKHARAINQILRMMAHLEGHEDYGKMWEQMKHNFFPSKFADPNVGEGTVLRTAEQEEPSDIPVVDEQPQEQIAYAEGDILENPDTGERVQFKGGVWAKL